MKKIALFLMVFLVIASPAHAREKKAISQGGTSVSAATSAPLHKEVSREEMKKKIEEKKKELNGSEWKVALTSGAKAEGEDVLTFQNGQVSSKMFSDKGYPASNYTISAPEGADMTTWETMQTNPKGGVVFMRGEWKEGVMRGVISQQIEEGKTKDYNFSSDNKIEVPPSTETPKEEKKEAGAEAMAEKAAETANSDVAAFDPGTTDEKR